MLLHYCDDQGLNPSSSVYTPLSTMKIIGDNKINADVRIKTS